MPESPLRKKQTLFFYKISQLVIKAVALSTPLVPLEWVLPSGSGWKIVCVRFSDRAGNESNPVCDAVWLEER